MHLFKLTNCAHISIVVGWLACWIVVVVVVVVIDAAMKATN